MLSTVLLSAILASLTKASPTTPLEVRQPGAVSCDTSVNSPLWSSAAAAIAQLGQVGNVPCTQDGPGTGFGCYGMIRHLDVALDICGPPGFGEACPNILSYLQEIMDVCQPSHGDRIGGSFNMGGDNRVQVCLCTFGSFAGLKLILTYCRTNRLSGISSNPLRDRSSWPYTTLHCTTLETSAGVVK